MTNWLSNENIKSRLEQLEGDEQYAKSKIQELEDLQKQFTTIKEKCKINEIVMSFNDGILAIDNERIILTDILKMQMESGRFLINFIYHSLFLFDLFLSRRSYS